jgi:hypothetical protein
MSTKPAASRPAVSTASTAVAPTAPPAPTTSRIEPTTTLTIRPADHDVPGGGSFPGAPVRSAVADPGPRGGATARADASEPPISSRNGGYTSVISAE